MRSRYALVLRVFICAASSTNLWPQVPKPAPAPPVKTEPAATHDPLGRETPRSAVIGFLKRVNRGDYSGATHYLQAPTGRTGNLEEEVKQLRALRGHFEGSIALLSDDPEGALEPGLPPGEVRAGRFHVASSTADVILVRVDDPAAGKIWLISKETLESAARLIQMAKREPPNVIARFLPRALTETDVFGMSAAQWVGWLLSLPASYFLAWVAGFLLSVPRLIFSKLRNTPFRPIWKTRYGMPLRYFLAISINSLSIYLLNPPLLYRYYYLRFMAACLAACLVWLLARIADQGFERALNRARVQHTGAESILALSQRFLRVLLFLVAFVIGMAILGFNITTALAGLGIGGLAIALAAQRTVENVFGGISLLADKAVHTGSFCKVGDQLGVVEDIGLRSVKIRTLDQTLLVVPNSSMVQTAFQNFSSRKKCLLNQRFSLRIETEVEQLRYVRDRVQRMLDEHPAIERGTSRIRVANFAGAAFELELWAYGKTGDWGEFTVIREDVILQIAEIVAASGTQFAAPTQLTYFSHDLHASRAADGKRRVPA